MFTKVIQERGIKAMVQTRASARDTDANINLGLPLLESLFKVLPEDPIAVSAVLKTYGEGVGKITGPPNC